LGGYELISFVDNGDPSQDVAVATILFLVDGKLVLLQPTTSEAGELKYEMRIIAQNVETYALMRDHPAFALGVQEDSLPPSPSAGLAMNGVHGHDLRDSLWFFDGQDVRVWIDMQDVLASASVELGRELGREVASTVRMEVDFYPLTALINKGIVFGVESELVQRRDTSFAYLRFGTRVCCGCFINAGAAMLIVVIRHTSSYHHSYDTTSPSTTILQLCTSATTTSTYSTFPMRSRSSSTKSLTKKSTRSLRWNKPSFHPFYHFFLHSRNTWTL
jgi:hypothetical protein